MIGIIKMSHFLSYRFRLFSEWFIKAEVDLFSPYSNNVNIFEAADGNVTLFQQIICELLNDSVGVTSMEIHGVLLLIIFFIFYVLDSDVRGSEVRGIDVQFDNSENRFHQRYTTRIFGYCKWPMQWEGGPVDGVVPSLVTTSGVWEDPCA